MRNVTKVWAAAGLIALSFGLAGCQDVGVEAPKEAPELVLQEGLAKLSTLTSYSYNLGLKGDLKGPVGNPPEKVTFDATLVGNIDTKDAKDPKMNLTLKGTMAADADGADAEVVLRLNKDAIYLNVKGLNGKGSIAIPEEMKQELINKWWSLPIPPEALEEMTKSLPQGGESTLTEEQKQMKALVEQTKFFKNVVYVNTESVNGEQSNHYTGELDKDAFIAFIVKAAELQGDAVSADEQAEMKTSFASFDFAGDFYVGKDSGIMNKVKGNLIIKANADQSSPSGTVTLEASVADFNKAMSVEVPADAQPIPMEALGALPL